MSTALPDEELSRTVRNNGNGGPAATMDGDSSSETKAPQRHFLPLNAPAIPSLDTQVTPSRTPAHLYSPITGLKLQTEQLAQKNRHKTHSADTSSIPESAVSTVYNAGLPVRNSSLRSTHSARRPRGDSRSPSSISSSPAVGPLVDMTPLPSPITRCPSLSRWRRSMDEDSNLEISENTRKEVPQATGNLDSPPHPGSTSPKKRKIPIVSPIEGVSVPSVVQQNENAHERNRSISEYTPNGLPTPKTRNIVVSASTQPAPIQQLVSTEDTMHREQNLAAQRGLVATKLPTPPASNQGSEGDEVHSSTATAPTSKASTVEYGAVSIRSGQPHKWQAIRQLGEGQFSKVMLATREDISDRLEMDPVDLEKSCKPRSLVAVKICQHGPAGGADEKSVQTSIKRELDLMRAINHPSLVYLKAVNSADRQTLFVLHYCPGGDLFELASTNLDLLSAPLIRRVFAELVSAVQYLHSRFIVHRDIKLENILVNLRSDVLKTISDWQTYQHPVVVLSDLGLGREIPKPPESPLLRRRCGSEDYAAPEVLIGQDYDGRLTDAWALGVVLYTLMEGRMPFDPVPGSRRKRATSHKIATCDWQWVRYADDDDEWDPVKGQGLEGARQVVEGLIARKRDRWDLDKVQRTEWVSEAIQVPGGLDRGDDES